MEPDNWGREPAVRQMRTLFAEMDRIQENMLAHAGISLLDARLRSIREAARNSFEKASARAADRGTGLNADARVALYTGCLYHALQRAGIELSPDLFPTDKLLLNLIREVSR